MISKKESGCKWVPLKCTLGVEWVIVMDVLNFNSKIYHCFIYFTINNTVGRIIFLHKHCM